MAGTHDDAVLIVEPAKWATMLGLPEAARAVFSEDFDPDLADLSDPHVQAVLNYFETVGTLVKNDLLNRELVLDWVWVPGFWARVGPAAERARVRLDSPMLYVNIEELATVPAGS
jgi:hypothetical protein